MELHILECHVGLVCLVVLDEGLLALAVTGDEGIDIFATCGLALELQVCVHLIILFDEGDVECVLFREQSLVVIVPI